MAGKDNKGFLVDAAEGGAGALVGGGLVQAVMDRAAADSKVATRNGVVAGLVLALGGAALGHYGRKHRLAQTLGLGVGAGAMGAVGTVAMQHLDTHISSSSAAMTQEQQDQLLALAQAENPEPASVVPQAPVRSVDLTAYADV